MRGYQFLLMMIFGVCFLRKKKNSFGQSIFFLFRGENVRWLHCPALEKGVYKRWLPLSDEFWGTLCFHWVKGSIEVCVFRVGDTRIQDMTSLTTGKILDDHYEERVLVQSACLKFGPIK